MRLLNRRIGLLFALFLLLLGLASHAGRLAGHRARRLAQGARGHPAGRGPRRAGAPGHDHRPPRRGAGRLRGRDHRLRQPVPDRRTRPAPPRSSRRSWAHSEHDLLKAALGPQEGLHLPAPQDGPRASARRSPSSRSRASARSSSRGGPTRRARWRPSCSARWAPTTWAWRASSSSTRRQLHGNDGRRRLVKDAMGEPISHHRERARRGGRGHAAHHRRRAPGAGRGGDGRGRPGPPPAGGHGAGHGPPQRRGAGAVELAARGRQRHRRRARIRAPEPRRGRQLRARIDLQGLHRGRRAGGEADQAHDQRSTCRRRSRWPTARSARPTTAGPRASPWPRSWRSPRTWAR